MYCEYCGAEYAPGQTHCEKCGSPLPDAPVVVAPATTTKPRKARPAAGAKPSAPLSLLLPPSSRLYIRWGPVAQDLHVYLDTGQEYAKIIKAVGPNGFEIRVTGPDAGIDLTLRQVGHTLFDVTQSQQLLARIEERLVVGVMKLTAVSASAPLSPTGEDPLATEHEKFAKRKDFYAGSLGGDKVASLRAAKAEDMPVNLEAAYSFQLDVKKQTVNFLHLLGLVLLVLFRYR